MSDSAKSRNRRRQWSRPDESPDLSLRELAGSKDRQPWQRGSLTSRSRSSASSSLDVSGDVSWDLSASRHDAGEGEHLGTLDRVERELFGAQEPAAGASSRPASRHRITNSELQLLRDSLLELDLAPRAAPAQRQPPQQAIPEGDSQESGSEVAEDFEAVSSDDDSPPPYLSTGSARGEGELRVMSAAGPPNARRRGAPSRPITRHREGTVVMAAEPPPSRPAPRPVSTASIRPPGSASARRRDSGGDGGSHEDMAGVLAALSKENEVALRASASMGNDSPGSSSLSSRSRAPAAKAKGKEAPSSSRDASAEALKALPKPSRAPAAGGGSPECSTPTLQKISGRLARLEPSKQRVLQHILDKLEQAEATGSIDVSAMFSSLGRGSPAAPANAPCERGRQEVTLRILSSVDGGREVGLTEIELFNAKGGLIPVGRDDLSVRGVVAPCTSISRIVSRRCRTTNEQHMWTGLLPEGGGPIDIAIRLPEGSEAARLLAWNYNRSIRDLGKGVREMQVYVDGVLTWHGTLARGCGNHTFDYSTAISLGDAGVEAGAGGGGSTSAGSSGRDSGAGGHAQQPKSQGGAHGKCVDELSNEELLEELRRRSVPVTPHQTEAESVRPVPGKSAPSTAKREGGLPDKTSASSAGRGADPSGPAPDERGSTTKPSNKSKLEVLRNRLSARRGSNGSPAARAADKARAEAQASKPTPEAPSPEPKGTDSDGCPVWLPRPSSRSKSRSEPIAGRRAAQTPRDLEEAPAGRSSTEQQQQEDSLNEKVDAGHPAVAPRRRPASSRRPSRPGSTSQAEPVAEPHVSALEGVFPPGDLEASLDSLEFFQRTQAGRLSQTIGRAGPSATAETEPESIDALVAAELSGLDGDDETDALVRDELALLEWTERRCQEDREEAVDEPFVIPERPSGRHLELKIHTTWGDPHYVGLCGIEMFDSAGRPIVVSSPEGQVSAEPSSINELADYKSDPRTPDKLVDGVNMTCDDLHVWLAPFEQGRPNRVSIALDERAELGMIRVWNYNKSRIHSQRGARMVEVRLDGELIFLGEVSRAPGLLSEAPAAAECILFTGDEAFLCAVEEHDRRYAQAQAAAEQQHDPREPAQGPEAAAPLEVVTGDSDDPLGAAAGRVGSDGRPMTTATIHPRAGKPRPALVSVAEEPPEEEEGDAAAATAAGPSPRGAHGQARGLKGRVLRITVLSTWGDMYYMGLAGLQVLGTKGEPIALQPSALDACPRDLNAIPGYSGDDRTLDKLLDGHNVTTDNSHMWLAPMKLSTLSGGAVSPDDPNGWLAIDFGTEAVEITGIRFWNYNKSSEDAARGFKVVQLFLDDRCISPQGGHLLAKAPGHCEYDFGQLIAIHSSLLETAGPPCVKPGSYHATLEANAWISAMGDPALAARTLADARLRKHHCTLVKQDFETPLLPCGFEVKFLLLSTWGDQHYIGLTGIEIIDAVVGPLQIDATRISALPRSVADLPGMSRDVRVPARLLDAPNTRSPSHSWLAPVASAGPGGTQTVNTLTVFLERPVMLAAVSLWNYSKTPQRGVQEMEILVDSQLVYKGYVRPAPADPQGPWKHTVLFHNDADLIASERGAVYSHLAAMEREAPIVLVNERRFVSTGSASARYTDPGERPSTSVVSSR